MSFHFSKSKFVSSCIRCNKYAWLGKYMPEEKSPIDDFAKSLFDNGHKVGSFAVVISHRPPRLMFNILILPKNVTLIIVEFLSLMFRGMRPN